MKTLKQTELAYLDRFCYEVAHLILGEGSISQQVQGYYSDLGALTNYAPLELCYYWATSDRPEPLVVSFPWRSLEEIPLRLAELESQARQERLSSG
jgi:hypothetical protein